MEQTVKRQSIFSILFGINEGSKLEDYIEITDKELLETQKSVDNKGKESEEPIVSENNSSKNGGSSKGIEKAEVKGINPETLNKMRKSYNKTKQEIEDDEIIK